MKNVKDFESYLTEGEKLPFKNDIQEVFPDVSDQEIRDMFNKFDIEDIEEVKKDINDDIKYVISDLKEEGIDYESLSQSEFKREVELRIDPTYPDKEDLYGILFKKMVTDKDQLEIKFPNVNESNIKNWKKFNEGSDNIRSRFLNFEYIYSFIKSRFDFEEPILDEISSYFAELLNKHDWRTLQPMLEEFLNIYDGADSLYDAFESWKKSWVSGSDEENPFENL